MVRFVGKSSLRSSKSRKEKMLAMLYDLKFVVNRKLTGAQTILIKKYPRIGFFFGDGLIDVDGTEYPIELLTKIDTGTSLNEIQMKEIEKALNDYAKHRDNFFAINEAPVDAIAKKIEAAEIRRAQNPLVNLISSVAGDYPLRFSTHRISGDVDDLPIIHFKEALGDIKALKLHEEVVEKAGLISIFTTSSIPSANIIFTLAEEDGMILAELYGMNLQGNLVPLSRELERGFPVLMGGRIMLVAPDDLIVDVARILRQREIYVKEPSQNKSLNWKTQKTP